MLLLLLLFMLLSPIKIKNIKSIKSLCFVAVKGLCFVAVKIIGVFDVKKVVKVVNIKLYNSTVYKKLLDMMLLLVESFLSLYNLSLYKNLLIVGIFLILTLIIALIIVLLFTERVFSYGYGYGYCYRDNIFELACFLFTKVKMKENKNLLVNRDRVLREELLEKEKEKEKEEKFLKDGYSIEKAAKETKIVKSVKSVKELEKPLKQIVIHGLVFNKLNDELWIDSSEIDIDIKKVYNSIQEILLDIQRIDSKGFINNRDLQQFPVISQFIKYFTNKEVYIKGNKVVESYKWIFNVLMTSLYEYSLKTMYKMEQDSEIESDLMVDFEELVKNIFSRIDPSIRIKLQKRGISILQNIYTGFDTEYVNKGDPNLNELLSVQLAVNTKSLLRIPKYSEYELSTIDTLTGEVYKLDKDTEDFNFSMVEKSLNRSIKEIRFLKYKENDTSILILIKGLQFLKFPFFEKEDSFVFSFPRSPVQPFIYYNEGNGYSFINMVNQSNLIGGPYLKEDYEKITSLLKGISKEVHFTFEWKEKGVEILKTIEGKELPGGLNLNLKKMSRTSLRGVGSDDKLSVTKICNNYFIAHLTNADLSIMNDFDTLKEELNIVNKCFVTLGKPIVIGNTNVYIRDTMLLAPQGCRSLEKIGSLYGEDFKKVDIAKDLKEEQKEKLTKDLTKEQKEKINLNQYIKENMNLLLKIDKELFESYAIKDAIIPLIHASYMEDFNFKHQGLGIPLTLSSLGAAYVKYKWKLIGYKGALWSRISLSCLQLSNSGDSLKFLVPNYYRKILSGWGNYSCKVTSGKMIEKEMGYRGSKSVVLKETSVKEQRVYGSWYSFSVANLCLRCTLMDFERNYQIKFLSNQINKYRFYTTLTIQSEIRKLDPWFLTGFSDAEGCFIISIWKNNKMKTGWSVNPLFQIGLHGKDIILLQQIQSYLGVGNISRKTDGSCLYSVGSIKDLEEVVIKHFDKYPLITEKYADYHLFKMVIKLIKNKEDLKSEGLRKIIAIRASLNWGLTSILKAAFLNIIPVPRLGRSLLDIKHPNWIAGFTSGEGCFFVSIMNSVTHSLGIRVKLTFQITQNGRDEQLMRFLIKYFDCGNIYKRQEAFDYKVTKVDDLVDKIIPFLNKYPVIGVKSEDFKDFCKVVEMIKNKEHLTVSGLDQIRKIKDGMNSRR